MGPVIKMLCYVKCDSSAVYELSIISCGIVKYNVDADIFNTWIEKVLLPDLADEYTIIMDNAAFHKSIVENKEHIIKFLPLYYSDSNLINLKYGL